MSRLHSETKGNRTAKAPILDGEDRVAILLKLLDDELAEVILADFPADKVEQIRSSLDDLDANPPSRTEVDLVVEEFESLFRFATEHVQPALRIADLGDADETAEDDSHPPEPVERPQLRCFQPTDDPFADLEQLAPFQVAGALLDEQPRTISLVLNCLDSEKAGETLQRLPAELRSQVFLEMKEHTTTSKDLLERIVRTTISKGCDLQEDAVADAEAESDKRLATMLRSMARKDRSKMLEALEESDGETAERLKQLLYVFDDIHRIEDRSLQKLLAEVDSPTLATALTEADPQLVEKVMNNLSKRARESLSEEIELNGAVDPEAIDEARNTVCEVIARLDQAGDLVMKS